MTNEEYKSLSAEQRKNLKFKDLPKRGKGIIISFLIVIVLIMTMCVNEFKSDSKSLSSTDSTLLISYSSSMAKKYVKETLISPSSAEFPIDDIRVWLLPDSTSVVKLSVDAQNAFGAMIRDNYYVKMKWYGDFSEKENWILLDIQNNQ